MAVPRLQESYRGGLPAPVKRVSIGNPDIADVLILRLERSCTCSARTSARPTCMLWDRDDELVSALNIGVGTHDLDGLRAS